MGRELDALCSKYFQEQRGGIFHVAGNKPLPHSPREPGFLTRQRKISKGPGLKKKLSVRALGYGNTLELREAVGVGHQALSSTDI